MDVSLVIKQRLNELGLDQRDLASATQVTESYVSQLLTRKKAPPAPGRTDIYDKIGELTNVQHLAQMDPANVLVMSGQRGSGPINLNTVALP